MNSNHTNLLRALASTTSVPADDIKDGPCDTILYGNINRRYTLSCKPPYLVHSSLLLKIPKYQTDEVYR